MNLEQRFVALKQWAFAYGMPNFAESAKKIPYGGTDERRIRTSYDELANLGNEMKRAIGRLDDGHFEICEGHYRKLFTKINTDLALVLFYNKVNELLEFGNTPDGTELEALRILHSNVKFMHWFPRSIYAKITESRHREVQSYG